MPKVIVLFSTKGGVGKSLIGTNLATYLAQEKGRKVCLIDWDTQTVGDMAKMANLQPQMSIVDLVRAMDSQPQSLKIPAFAVPSSFGFSFLPAVLNIKQSAHLDPKRVRDVFNLLGKDYDYLIVDGGKTFSETFLNILNQANLIFLVTTPDIISISQTRLDLDALQTLGFPLLMIKTILNRSGSASSLSVHEIKLHLPSEIIANIPSDGKAVGLSVNRGVPPVLDSPYSKFSASMQKLGDYLITNPKIFLEHQTIADTRIKEEAIDNDSDFWQKRNTASASFSRESTKEALVDSDIILLKQRIHNRLIEELNLKRLDQNVFSDAVKSKELKDKARVLITNFLAEETGTFISSPTERQRLVKELVDEALGYGPLEDLLADNSITDIMVNNKDAVYTELRGKLKLTDKKFISNDQVKTIIERIIAPIGRRIDESVPMVDARLPDGSRVNAVIPPLALSGPNLTIRKFRKERYTIEELIKINTLNQQMADFIKASVICRKNVIVSGGTGSGKTTILNILSSAIPESERIITIEDAAELKLSQEHWIRLESRPSNIEGKGAVTIRDLFRNTLRMRPDRIIVGECRGIETLDMLQAMNTGHDGSMTTVHANSTHDVLARLDSMILMSGIELPVRAIREMIASAVHLIVHTSRMSDGTRKITAVTEITGMQDETRVQLQDVFLYKQTGIDEHGNVQGFFKATGYIPKVLEEIKIKGIHLSEDVFRSE